MEAIEGAEEVLNGETFCIGLKVYLFQVNHNNTPKAEVYDEARVITLSGTPQTAQKFDLLANLPANEVQICDAFLLFLSSYRDNNPQRWPRTNDNARQMSSPTNCNRRRNAMRKEIVRVSLEKNLARVYLQFVSASRQWPGTCARCTTVTRVRATNGAAGATSATALLDAQESTPRASQTHLLLLVPHCACFKELAQHAAHCRRDLRVYVVRNLREALRKHFLFLAKISHTFARRRRGGRTV